MFRLFVTASAAFVCPTRPLGQREFNIGDDGTILFNTIGRMNLVSCVGSTAALALSALGEPDLYTGTLRQPCGIPKICARVRVAREDR